MRRAVVALLSIAAPSALCLQPSSVALQPKTAVQSRGRPAVAQFGFKVQKSERLLIREAWERADAFRPGKPNWFTKKQKDLTALHAALLPEYDRPTLPPPTNATSLLRSLLKVLTTGDLALTLCSPEPPVLTELRDWLVATMPMVDAVQGLPEEQGRVLATLVRSIDARRILDLGTFTGYSSIAMALAAADDAKVTCCEPQRRYANDARDWWAKAGVSAKMEMHEKDAVELLKEMLANGEAASVDFVFVDVSQRERYQEIHELLIQLMRVGGTIVYYDTLWSADQVLQEEPKPTQRAFNARLAKDPRVIASLVPLSYGITLCVKTMELDGVALGAARGEDERSGGKEKVHALLMLSPLYLPYISPIPPPTHNQEPYDTLLDHAHTSPISPPYLAYISQVHALLRERRKEVEAALAALPPPP